MERKNRENIKAVSLFSGGLDSTLAARIIQEQEIEVIAVHLSTPFISKGKESYETSKRIAREIGVCFKHIEIKEEYLEMLKNPKYGFGSALNPCIDCHILMLKKASEYMKEPEASFIVTGEVLGQRPMSQKKKDLKIVEKESGLKGLILRPLSAKLLSSTIPEKKGWVEREKLFDIQGRSRTRQMKLAKKYNIKNYLTPAGGCLLTEPGFSRRLEDLRKYKPDFNLKDVEFLKVGRHFRLTPKAKLVVGRDEEENNKLDDLSTEEEIIFYPMNVKGPLAVGRGVFSEESSLIASKITARYSKDASEYKIKCKKGKKEKYFSVSSMQPSKVKKYRL